MDGVRVSDTRILPRPRGCRVPLTYSQILTHRWTQEQGGVSVRVRASSVRILGRLDVSLLRASMEALVQRHESLRTRIIQLDGSLQQHIDAARSEHCELVDIGQLARMEMEREAQRLALEFIEEKIELAIGPLFSARLFRFSAEEHVLILAVDHIVSDDVSHRILNAEFWALYRLAVQGRPLVLPALPLQFADYAVWEQANRDDWLSRHEGYWRGRLSDAPRLQWPLAQEGPLANRADVASLHIPFGKVLTGKLRELASREGTLLPLVVLTAYVAAVSGWCRQQDLLVAFTSHGRHGRPELQGMIGALAGALHLRVRLNDTDTLLDVLETVRSEFSSACDNHDHSAVSVLLPDYTAEAVTLNWLSTTRSRVGAQEHSADDAFQLRPFAMPPFHNVLAGFQSLRAMAFEGAAGIVMTLWYRSALFDRKSLETFARNVCFLSEELTRQPCTTLSSAAGGR